MGTEVCQVFVSVDLDTVLRLRPHLFHCNECRCFCSSYLFMGITGNESSVKTPCNVHLFWIPQKRIFYFHGHDHFVVCSGQFEILLVYN